MRSIQEPCRGLLLGCHLACFWRASSLQSAYMQVCAEWIVLHGTGRQISQPPLWILIWLHISSAHSIEIDKSLPGCRRSVCPSTHLEGCEGELKISPDAINPVQSLLDDLLDHREGRLLQGAIHNLAADLHCIVQLQLEQVPQVEVRAHLELLPSSL